MMQIQLVFVLFLSVVFSAQIPSKLKKCSRNDKNFDECLRIAVEDAIIKGTSPVKEISLISLDPLDVPALTIGAGTGAVAFSQEYKDVKLLGLSNMKCSKVDFNFEKKTLFLDCTSPKVSMKCNYEVNGKLLLLPVFGKGPGLIELENPNFKVLFTLEEIEKKGKKYFKVNKTDLDLNPSFIKFRFENLFNGDKTLSDNIHQVLNDNWKEVFADVKPGYENAYGQIATSVFNSVLAKVSIDELVG